jgi:hypothetical protein
MNKLEGFLNENDSLKRLGLTAITPAIAAYLSQHGASENIILAVIAFMASVIAGSNAHAAAKAKGDVAAKEAGERTAEETAAKLGGAVQK